MYEDEIALIDAWFDEHEECGTYHHTEDADGEDIYVIDASNVEDFCDYIRAKLVDLIGFRCYVNGDGIWFKPEDLDYAKHY